jgi:hypothetical protein
MKKKAKALKKASTKNKVIKPVKAFTGMEVALIAGAAGLLGSGMLGRKTKSNLIQRPIQTIRSSNDTSRVCC